VICKECKRRKVKPLRKRCPECLKKGWKRVKKYRTLNKEKYKLSARKSLRNWQLKRFFNLTIEQYIALELAQKGRCAICRKTKEQNGKSLAVDHDHGCCSKHSCGKCIRGLICDNCNRTIGLLNDSLKNAKALVRYLKKYRIKFLRRNQ